MGCSFHSEQCKLLNDSAKSELSTMFGFSGNESSSISDNDESSDEDDRSSTNDNIDSVRNSDGGVDDNDATEQCQEKSQEVPLIVTQALQ